MMMIEESCWESITSWTIINNNKKSTSKGGGEEKETPPPVELLPVRIQKIPNKDYGLVATRTIRKGEIVFGECAPIGSTIVGTKPTLLHLAHCNTCLKCMEPSTTFFFSSDSNNLPMPHLWPNPDFSNEWMTALEDYSYDEDDKRVAGNGTKHMMEDDYGRMLCRQCKSMFCSQKCQDDFHKFLHVDCCCLYQRLMDRLADIAYEQDHGKSLAADHWEIVLATKLFCTLVATAAGSSSSEALKLQQAINGMCGSPDQITILQAGILIEEENDDSTTTSYYTVEPFYNIICDTLSLTPQQQKEQYPLEFFERLVVIGRRNSVDIQTTSLFTIYNKRLMESCGGNDGSDYKSHLQQIIVGQQRSNHPSAINATDLNRFGSIGCCSILPLFSRINHSCQPNLEVCDAGGDDDGKPCVELIATHDIQEGEELSISYLSDNRLQSNYVARNKRLQSNYLFTCDCSRCKNEKERQRQEEEQLKEEQEEKKETNK